MAEPVGRASLVACQLTLAAAAARPGETVTALLQVSCSQPEAVELQEVEIEFSGIERIDTSWVQPAYRRATPPINADKRKVQRHVVQSRLQAATQGTFSDLSLRRFVVRFTLPAWLPPTFRGTAVRYLYYLEAIVKYRAARGQQQQQEGVGGSSSKSNGVGGQAGAASAAASVAGSASSGVATRIPLHIWPAKADSAGAAERSPALLGGSLPPPALQSEDMPIKCWEIGPGTAVQDAVAHIVKLASQPQQASRPHSPGGRLARGSGAGSSAGGDDSRSEISHDAQEGEAVAEEGDVAPGGGGGSGLAVAATPVTAVAAPPMPPRLPPEQLAVAAATAQQQLPPQGTPASSGASTPHSRLPARRPPLSRSSLDQSASLALPRSPSQLLDSGSTLRSYALRIGDQPLVRVSLHPPLEGSLQPGSTLAGTLDFSPQPPPQPPAAAAPAADGEAGAAPPAPAAAAVAGGPSPCCIQVLILLETEEIVEAPWRRQVQGGGAGAIRRVYDEQLEVTADTSCTHFLFTIPPDAAASFQTPLVQLRWLLRFQFTAIMPPPRGGAAAAAPGAAAPAEPPPPASPDWSPLQGRLEQLTWALPVTVLPPTS
ncbi:hypothetical protein CHLNCDRAFT_140640 [Chlorella variabilis]|uniref:Uncharacterized protein n=1 Tax=Chlorella variabilis TaxID=554065 RepID=E1Z5V1_CHLVA|nr:hypothetical protein CHLNCDRAFT_140640 [Chlorella variabilis]EFN58536.1 hypothetical protein CHLNCDRAFT_140640 [Chlorella variabilis]|eukprot:XP_005850638.1 hypothetical protein CHLNCDRAFT_140640 [Chlorella variabilis]